MPELTFSECAEFDWTDFHSAQVYHVSFEKFKNFAYLSFAAFGESDVDASVIFCAFVQFVWHFVENFAVERDGAGY
ncbi:MAG: hypothetical protein UW03_C0012G0005 [Candidatus Peregrinibacteria bacterium GW2011_GWA2_43_8]|nr:MAG: hypothetical protein UW03_C0012G0005 [Candidatus Peregrinibacteria bacterium GW2011_GWA2_43_8]